VSERRACAALGQHRSTQRKAPLIFGQRISLLLLSFAVSDLTLNKLILNEDLLRFDPVFAIDLSSLASYLLQFSLNATAGSKLFQSGTSLLKIRTVERSSWKTECHVETSRYTLPAESVERLRRGDQRSAASRNYHYWKEQFVDVSP
jgi:hypothetical protein